MQVALASRPGPPGTTNLDWAGAAGGVAVVLDGLTEAAQTGCRHGTAWYVHQLGCRLLAEAGATGGAGTAGGADRPLADALADALAWVAGAHAGSCDLRHPGAPAATVAAVRRRGPVVDYLVLSDAVAVLDADSEEPGDGAAADPVVVTDRRVEEHLADLIGAANTSAGDEGALRALIEAQQRLRNRPAGYWVAQSDPAAAGQALCGELTGVRTALLLSDGAALLATLFGATSWRELVDLGLTAGPDAIITATRELEARDPDRSVWPRYKTHDDATAVVCDLR